ncbi:unnamed protein product [Schistosoma rodhaini]|nr:unnamed protein product [Schistosoma rodhaini]
MHILQITHLIIPLLIEYSIKYFTLGIVTVSSPNLCESNQCRFYSVIRAYHNMLENCTLITSVTDIEFVIVLNNPHFVTHKIANQSINSNRLIFGVIDCG